MPGEPAHFTRDDEAFFLYGERVFTELPPPQPPRPARLLGPMMTWLAAFVGIAFALALPTACTTDQGLHPCEPRARFDSPTPDRFSLSGGLALEVVAHGSCIDGLYVVYGDVFGHTPDSEVVLSCHGEHFLDCEGEIPLQEQTSTCPSGTTWTGLSLYEDGGSDTGAPEPLDVTGCPFALEPTAE